MLVRWQFNDGYAGKARPQYTTINDDDLAECETEEERQELIQEAVEEDFNNKGFSILETN